MRITVQIFLREMETLNFFPPSMIATLDSKGEEKLGGEEKKNFEGEKKIIFKMSHLL